METRREIFQNSQPVTNDNTESDAKVLLGMLSWQAGRWDVGVELTFKTQITFSPPLSGITLALNLKLRKATLFVKFEGGTTINVEDLWVEYCHEQIFPFAILRL